VADAEHDGDAVGLATMFTHWYMKTIGLPEASEFSALRPIARKLDPRATEAHVYSNKEN